MPHVHVYRSALSWEGSTGVGYEAYERSHSVILAPTEAELALSSDAAFRGDADRTNPEQLLLAAASSCQLLSFLALAARSRVDVLAYEDSAEAVMPDDAKPMRITRITLRPRIVVGNSSDRDRVTRLVERAHHECFIANTLNAEIDIQPVIETSVL